MKFLLEALLLGPELGPLVLSCRVPGVVTVTQGHMNVTNNFSVTITDHHKSTETAVQHFNRYSIVKKQLSDTHGTGIFFVTIH